mmetsp:Transcript_160709/g.308627  ORF Transcript_160709/g.308627 Transcript_160709/m.308627 type:complete len:549 (+) Transcript_160709:77-1723(+)
MPNGMQASGILVFAAFQSFYEGCGISLVNRLQVQLTHPGHPPHHVTRLHRYDHQGLESMLEAESKWEQGREIPETASAMIQLNDAKQADQPLEDKFLQLSPAQVRGLREQHALHDGFAVTRLQSLTTQYIGPIGVGSVLAPPNCVLNMETPLEFKLKSQAVDVEENSTSSQRPTCHLEEESQVWVIYDTGSTNIWISSDLCKRGPCTEAGRNRYNHTVSKTYELPELENYVNVRFGTGRVSGPQAMDDFHIGLFSVHRQTFAMIEVAEGPVFEEVPFEGIVGLAYPAMSANGAKPFFDTIVEQKALRHNEFAFYFSRDKPAANAVFWGGVDPTFYKGDISYFPVVDPYYWSLKLKSFSIGNDDLMGVKDVPANNSALLQKKSKAPKSGKKSGWNGPFAILDTGTTFFTAEAKKYKEVMSRLPSAKCNEVTDKSHPPITFRLETAAGKDQDFVLTNRQYMTKTGNGTEAKCTTAFMQIDIPPEHGPAMILGEVFLRNFFAVFDRQDGIPHHGRVGLATASHEPDAEARIKDLTKNQAAWHGVTANGELQ